MMILLIENYVVLRNLPKLLDNLLKTQPKLLPKNLTFRPLSEAIHIRKEGQQAMNRDEGSYQLSHAYDRFLDTASSRCVNFKNRNN